MIQEERVSLSRVRRVSFLKTPSLTGTPFRRPSALFSSAIVPPDAETVAERSPQNYSRGLEEFGEAKWLAEAKKQQRDTFSKQEERQGPAMVPVGEVDRDGAVEQWHKVYEGKHTEMNKTGAIISRKTWEQEQQERIAREKESTHTDGSLEIQQQALQQAKEALQQLQLQVLQEQTLRLQAVAEVEALSSSKRAILQSKELAGE